MITLLVKAEIGSDAVEAQYYANLTGEPYLYFELKQVAKLSLAGLSPVEIRAKIKDENLFQSATNKSIDKLLRATLKRVAILDEVMLNILVNGSLHTSKLVTLIAIVKTNRLFWEFIEEVYMEKVQLGEQELEPKDFRIFFNNKAEQSSKVAGWQEYTLKKLSAVYSRILFEAGLINNTHQKTLTPPTIEEELLNHLRKLGDHRLIRAITGGRMS
ncbi:DUF1819 family protein [Desulfosporosinus sp. SB140]|uniref:DUF1819 family protein n=1 Tax=Desulfosporosinus paludis TaxID=3115649 RepID=UPI00388F1E5A